MAKKYFVIAKETCPRCGGHRVICPNADFYNDYYKFIDALVGLDREESIKKQDQWIRDRGFDPNHMPPAEIECDTCHGMGEVVGEVPLEEALKELGIGIGTVIPESMKI